ncbi:site-specific integrase [Candidatus Palauibacter polyketidifaciens]|uniref:site-specific integrase n=1 Tax=Candidatus Palauibacter polyketidifaciens TaxID=3056740 RepID=UPI002387D22C|nr:site-specific integrase [Candidatus Palauibacter polyketidifaciens]MDE2721634.1 site-specific integrase [Candidatus Palauibacter polyketidifaciens]
MGERRIGPPETPAGPLGEYLDAAADGSLSANTVRALRADLERFAAWCAERDLSPLPASPAAVAAYVEEVSRGLAPATVRRHVSSIAALHRAAGERSPSEHAEVRWALRRMGRRKGSRQEQVEGLTWALRQRLIGAGGSRLIDVRNRAILAVAYDAMLRRSELVALEVVDVTVDRGGSASVLVRRAKTDPEGGGAVLYLHKDSVRLLKVWLAESGVAEGPLFRSVRKDGTLGGALHPGQVPRIYKAMAKRAGVRAEVVERLSGHSPRVGAAQDMIASGIELPAIMQAGRWRSVRMVQRYGERLLARRNGAAQLARLQKRG